LEMVAYGFWLRERFRAQGRCFPAIVLDEHNAEYLLQRRAAEIYRQAGRRLPSLYARVQAHRLERYESSACQAVDVVVAVSAEDRQALLNLVPEARISVVPNGVDTDAYAPLPAGPVSAAPMLVFTGHMGFRPNVDAVQWFCDAIWPRIRAEVPQARLQIVGRDPTPAVRALDVYPGVEVTGPVPDDRPYIGRADLYVLPMRFGGGIRLKLLQALSMARPMVSTSMGAEGVEGLVDGQHLFLADQAESFALRAVQLLRDPSLQRRFGQAGRELVVAGYDWRVLVPRFESILVSAAQEGGVR
jgi:glycosyltransferase involved in cell wall biosynthesis